MLWYKSWLETRWRFLIGLLILVLSACSVVFAYPKMLRLLTAMPNLDLGGEIGRRVQEQIAISSNYRGYIWSQWFRQNCVQIWTIFAVLLGSGGLLSPATGGAAIFTLSLPVSRDRLIGIRAATGLAELFVLAFVPSLLIPLFSPSIGESYSIGVALIHALCIFVTGATFFSLAFLLSTIFADIWRPLLIALGLAAAIGVLETFIDSPSGIGVFGVMSGETFFRSGSFPWLGVSIAATASAAMLYGARQNFARRDF